MDPKFVARKKRLANKYYVEVIGGDGLIHHVGPFITRTNAKEWIAQNSSQWTPSPDPDRKLDGRLE